MKKRNYLIFATSLTLMFSCSNDNTQELKESVKDAKSNTIVIDFSEPFIAYNTETGPMGFYGTGPGSYEDAFSFRDGGNCIVPSSVCIITWPPKGGDLNKKPEIHDCKGCWDDIELAPLDPIDEDEIKEFYLKDLLKDLYLNLDKSELVNFEESMRFTKSRVLASWDMKLLEKGTGKNFETVIKKLSYDLTNDDRKIILTEPSTGKERIIK